MAEEKLNLLKNRRKILRTAVTKHITKLESFLAADEVTVEELEETIETLNDRFKSLKITDNEIEVLLKPGELEKEFEAAEKYAENVVLWKSRANKKIRELNKELLNVTSKTEKSSEKNSDDETNSKPKHHMHVKLPKLNIAKFYGNINNWLSFWNTFESAIHNNTALTKVDKFNYLKAHLCDTALNTIEGLPISDTAYDSAVDLLKERFGNKNILIHNHMSNILNIKPLKNSNDVNAFRKFYNKISTELRSLEALGAEIENISSVLCTTLLKSIPQDLLIELNKAENQKGYYEIKKLMDFLSMCLIAREKAIAVSNSINDSGFRKNSSGSTSNTSNYKFSNDKIKNPYTAKDLVTTNMREKPVNVKCPFCDSSQHAGSECAEALKLSLQSRKDLLLRKGACFKCLEMRKHISKFCDKKNIICEKCQGKHASLMCFKYEQDPYDKSPKTVTTENTLISNQCLPNEVYLQTLIARISNNNKEHFVRVILDTASSKSYVSSFVAKKLNLKSLGKIKVTHGLFGGTETTVDHNCYSINLKGLNENKVIEIDVMEQEKICATVPKVKDVNCIKELKGKNIFLSDICYKSRNCLYERDANEIHVLLGANVVGKLFTGVMENLSCGLVAMQTVLGWTAMGRINDRERNSSLFVNSLFVNEAKITDLWSLDSLGITDPAEKQTKNEVQKLVMQHFNETVCREKDGRYKVCLPWINGHPTIFDNKELAEKRLRNNIKSLKASGLVKEYEQVFNEWEEEGIIERVKIEEDLSQNVHYLPHRAVIKPNSTTKIRPVFDGSAHAKGSVSINDCVEKGPNLIELIPSILNRFRWGKIGVVADIRKAFLQISLNDQDRDYLRFFWWKDGNPENLITYKHCRVVFGISSSPFLLAATLVYHLDHAPENVRNVALKLKESFYVDNCVTSVESFEELDYFRSESQKLLASAKFDLRGWCHNNDSETELNNFESNSKIPLLGLLWDTEKDTLSCDFSNFKIDEQTVTKRTILSLTHKIFDPIGFTCPLTLIPKLLLQKCWKIKASWDSKLPEELIKEFEKWKMEINELENVCIPRRLSHLSLAQGKLSLHIFCDASKSSYATCIFLRTEFPNEVSCQLVQARSRVAPLKDISIPRLELLACCIGARLADTIIRDLKLENIEKFYWSDSMDVLFWIKGEGPWGTFVENRVKEIRKLSSLNSWNFVPGHMNPADLPSRGCSMKSLVKSEWWLGPTWLLKSEDNWPSCNIEPNMNVVNSEKRKTIVTATNLENKETKFYNRYSSYPKIIRITGWIFRFYENSKTVNTNRTSSQLNEDELRKAEIVLLKSVQQEHFANPSDTRLKSLRTVTDSDGILRIKTKIFMREDNFNFRLPIILPSNNHVVEQLIMWKHTQFGHCGVQFLMTVLRENYWVLKCRKTVKNVINKCITCKKLSSKPPVITDSVLPTDRVKNASIFEIVGVDLAGPLYLKNESKVWILMVTCAVFRAVHLELLTSPSTDNFILGFSRFISRRGRPSIVYCDQGSNFVGARNLLQNIDIEKLKSLNKFSPIKWELIPPASPWWGGFWERLIGILKRILRRVLGKSSLNYDEMSTLLCDCESIINSRPLTYVSENIEDLSPLTPAMFLHEIPEIGIPELQFLDKKKMNKRYLYRVKLRENLCNRFRTEYLGTLRQSLVGGKDYKPLQQGDVVVIWTDNAKRMDWPLGRILEIFPSKDNIARVAKVKTTSGILIRPIKKLCPLELSDPKEVPDSVTTRRGRAVRRPARLGVG